MSPMKRVQKVVLFLVAVALLPCALALAGSVYVTNLTCVVEDPLDPDYDASGVAKLANVRTSWGNSTIGPWLHTAKLSVSCRGLTPGARYTVTGLGTFTVESSGNLNVGGKVEWSWGGFDVWVVREDGVAILVGTVF